MEKLLAELMAKIDQWFKDLKTEINDVRTELGQLNLKFDLLDKKVNAIMEQTAYNAESERKIDDRPPHTLDFSHVVRASVF